MKKKKIRISVIITKSIPAKAVHSRYVFRRDIDSINPIVNNRNHVYRSICVLRVGFRYGVCVDRQSVALAVVERRERPENV